MVNVVSCWFECHGNYLTAEMLGKLRGISLQLGMGKSGKHSMSILGVKCM